MPKWLKRLVIEVPIFAVACLLVGFIFTLSALSVRDGRFEALFIENSVTSLATGLGAYFCGFFAYQRVSPARLRPVYLTSLTASIIGGLCGRTVALFLHQARTGELPLRDLDLVLSFIPTTAMTFLIATGCILYWFYSDEKIPASNDMLEFKAEGKLCYVVARDICYLTAIGKKTVVHTETKDYTVNLLLKDFLAKFPIPGLLRAHKKHAVQTRAIDSLTPGRSGEYLASVADNAFLVPVSPKFLTAIRQAKSR